MNPTSTTVEISMFYITDGDVIAVFISTTVEISMFYITSASALKS